MERYPSGSRGGFAKPVVWRKLERGFESLSLRCRKSRSNLSIRAAFSFTLNRMTPEIYARLRALIEANRARALWNFPADYFPADVADARAVLERIAARGDRATFVAARRLLAKI